MKLADVRKLLEPIHPDTLGQSKGEFIARWEFFYTHGMTSDKKAEMIQKLIPTARIIKAADVWKPFRGSASTAQSSHFLVRFKA